MRPTRITDAEFIHIPPPPARPCRPPLPSLRRAGQTLLGALGEASLVGMATLGFAWGAAELAFVLFSH